jgi:hypothetical protein
VTIGREDGSSLSSEDFLIFGLFFFIASIYRKHGIAPSRIFFGDWRGGGPLVILPNVLIRN